MENENEFKVSEVTTIQLDGPIKLPSVTIFIEKALKKHDKNIIGRVLNEVLDKFSEIFGHEDSHTDEMLKFHAWLVEAAK